MGLTSSALLATSMVTMAAATATGAGVGIYSMVDSRKQAKASQKAANEATLATAAASGRAEAQENALRDSAKAGAAKEAENLDLEASKLARKKHGVQSTYTAASDGAGAGMMKGTTLSPIGG